MIVFKKDKEIVLIAVKNDGYALEYADESFKKDKEIVLIAVKQYGRNLEYADDSLKKDKEIVLEAAKTDPLAIKFADISLRKKIDPSYYFSETIVYGENLCCNQFIINESDINSTDKIIDFFSRPYKGGFSHSYTKGIKADPYDSPKEGIDLHCCNRQLYYHQKKF